MKSHIARDAIVPASISFFPANSVIVVGNSAIVAASISFFVANSAIVPASSAIVAANSAVVRANCALVAVNSALVGTSKEGVGAFAKRENEPHIRERAISHHSLLRRIHRLRHQFQNHGAKQRDFGLQLHVRPR